MDFVNAKAKEEEESDEEEESEEEDVSAKKTSGKRPAPASKTTATKKKKSNDDDENDDKRSSRSGPKKTKSAKRKIKKGSDDEGGDKPKKSGNKQGYLKCCKLSPELASLMGEDSMPRHAVVKKVWQIIKEQNLYDPKNKQFAICSPELQKVMGVKRFRTFGMLKHLRDHFIED